MEKEGLRHFYKEKYNLTQHQIEALEREKVSAEDIKKLNSEFDNADNGLPALFLNQGAHAAMHVAADGTRIVSALTEPNVSSPVHELAHIWEFELTDLERSTV